MINISYTLTILGKEECYIHSLGKMGTQVSENTLYARYFLQDFLNNKDNLSNDDIKEVHKYYKSVNDLVKDAELFLKEPCDHKTCDDCKYVGGWSLEYSGSDVALVTCRHPNNVLSEMYVEMSTPGHGNDDCLITRVDDECKGFVLK